MTGTIIVSDLRVFSCGLIPCHAYLICRVIMILNFMGLCAGTGHHWFFLGMGTSQKRPNLEPTMACFVTEHLKFESALGNH